MGPSPSSSTPTTFRRRPAGAAAIERTAAAIPMFLCLVRAGGCALDRRARPFAMMGRSPPAAGGASILQRCRCARGGAAVHGVRGVRGRAARGRRALPAVRCGGAVRAGGGRASARVALPCHVRRGRGRGRHGHRCPAGRRSFRRGCRRSGCFRHRRIHPHGKCGCVSRREGFRQPCGSGLRRPSVSHGGIICRCRRGRCQRGWWGCSSAEQRFRQLFRFGPCFKRG